MASRAKPGNASRSTIGSSQSSSNACTARTERTDEKKRTCFFGHFNAMSMHTLGSSSPKRAATISKHSRCKRISLPSRTSSSRTRAGGSCSKTYRLARFGPAFAYSSSARFSRPAL
ncbi:MAG: hypothetical protein H6723_10655 [Sandaracinus sp.]|nr:hypothetical protein [Sandaracinus sp.]